MCSLLVRFALLKTPYQSFVTDSIGHCATCWGSPLTALGQRLRGPSLREQVSGPKCCCCDTFDVIYVCTVLLECFFRQSRERERERLPHQPRAPPPSGALYCQIRQAACKLPNQTNQTFTVASTNSRSPIALSKIPCEPVASNICRLLLGAINITLREPCIIRAQWPCALVQPFIVSARSVSERLWSCDGTTV